MNPKSPQWIFYAQVLTRALNELESACKAPPETQEYKFYRAEASVVLDEAREALAALKHYLRTLEAPDTEMPRPPTRH